MPQQEPGRGAALRRAQDDQQERAFTLWFNSASGCGLESVVTGLRSGTALIALLESLGAESLGRHNRAPSNEPQCLDNLQVALDWLASREVRLVGISPKSLYDSSRTACLGLVYTLIVKYEVHRHASDVRDLLRWMQEQVQPYEQAAPPRNFTAALQDGLVLGCLLHAHFPDLIELEDLQPGVASAALNNATVLAALETIGVPRMLDADALGTAPPDEKTAIAFVGVVRHKLEEEAERRRAARRAAEEERLAQLEAAQTRAAAEAAAAIAAQEAAAAARAQAEAEAAAAALEQERREAEERAAALREAERRAQAAREAKALAEVEARRSLLAKGLSGWLFKQSAKDYDTFFRRWFVYGDGVLRYYKDSKEADAEGKQISLSEIVDVRPTFDDPTLVLGGRSLLLNFQFVDGSSNTLFRLSAEDEAEVAAVEQWLRLLRCHALAEGAPRTAHNEPPPGSERPSEPAAEAGKAPVSEGAPPPLPEAPPPPPPPVSSQRRYPPAPLPPF